MNREQIWATSSLLACLLAAACQATAAGGDSDRDAVPHPLSPEQAIEQFQTAPGLRVELAASEPDVVDPVAIRFDEQGRMWVVEMRDYPHGPAAGEPPKSRIKVLEDRDADGRFETVRVFADELLFATGVQPWRDGVIVTLAGRIAYLEDTDGDGRADHQQTWYQGFAEQNSQLRANHPRFALDGHIYVANGLRGGSVVDARRPDAPTLSLSGKDFRFHPETSAYEVLTGVGQFGLTFDDFGNRFVCSNRNPLIHIVLEDRYIARNPSYAPPAAVHDVAAAGAESRIFPISRAWTTSNLHAGQFTAACGVLIYRGNALPRGFYGNGFTCDPTGNLVHRERLARSGATFTSHPARDGVEFLASPDEWFRPVNLALGPDGALYVVDMHRAVIEHPQFMPDELKQRPDLLDGSDCGRIYRISALADGDRSAWPELGSLNGPQLAGLLEHPNAWQRETAARLLFQRQDATAAERLRQIAVDGRHAAARVAALWVLHGLNRMDADLLRIALKDDEPRVCEQAVALAELYFADQPQLRRDVAALATHDDPRVRFQVALVLTPVRGEFETAALTSIALAGSDDVWTRRAVVMAAGGQAGGVLLAMLADPPWRDRPPRPHEIELLGDFVAVAVSSKGVAPDQLLAAIATLQQDEQASQAAQTALLSFARTVTRQRTNLAAVLNRLPEEPQAAVRKILASAAATARDADAAAPLREDAIQLVGYDDAARDTLIELAVGEPLAAVRSSAIGALARRNDDAPWPQLIAHFPAESPAIRRAIVSAVLARGNRTTLLLDAIEAGQIKPGEIDRTQVDRLLKHGDAAIRKRAGQLLAAAVPEDRRKVLDDYQVALKLAGDPHRGREVFSKRCATCHRIGDVGVNVAPDISDSRTKKPEQILLDVLQPNRAIDNNYVGYLVVTADGVTLTGIIASETATSVTLRQAEGKEQTLLRSEIEEMRSSGISLMPDGLEKDIPPQAMADLISFIKNWRYLDGLTPLGTRDE